MIETLYKKGEDKGIVINDVSVVCNSLRSPFSPYHRGPEVADLNRKIVTG